MAGDAQIRLDLPLLLPDVGDARDTCVARLRARLSSAKGVTVEHLIGGPDAASAALCVHYDPRVATLAEIERMVKAEGATVTAQFGHAIFPLRAIDGEDAALRIERSLAAVPGVLDASVSLPAQRARVEFDRRQTDEGRIRVALAEMGYAPLEPRPGEEPGWYARNRELTWSLAGGALLALAWSLERWSFWDGAAARPLYLAAYVFGAADLVRHTWGALRKGRLTFDIDLLMLLAAVGAAAIGEWAEGALLLFLFSLAHALEHYALDRARYAIRALADLAPPRARVLRDRQELEVPVEQVRVGETVVVRPGERIPVDGTVAAGRSAVNQAPVTGESVPVEKQGGSQVFAGTVNGDGALEVTTTGAVGDRTLDRVIALVEEAQTQKAPTQTFTDRFERLFVPAVLIADVLVMIVPPLFGWWSWSTSIYRAMALLVAASPCALALGTPAAVLAGIAQAARRGVLIKGGAHLENLGRVTAIAFDKTGTLTIGRPEVTVMAPADGVQTAELLRIAAAVERRSQHPLAQAVVRRAIADAVALPEAGELQSITGRGVRSTVSGETVEIGALKLWENGDAVPTEVTAKVATLQQSGHSTMVVRHGTRWLGVLGLSDPPREAMRAVLAWLRRLGVTRLIMLTGDNAGVGRAVAGSLGISDVRADLMPDDKVTAVKDLLETHGSVAMVGDGVNDAPALAHATVGIAMGGAGTAVALETADVALMADDLAKLPFAIGLARKARAIIRQNLYLSLAVIAMLVVASVSGVAGIGTAVLVHEGSTLVVVGNALRLLMYEGNDARDAAT